MKNWLYTLQQPHAKEADKQNWDMKALETYCTWMEQLENRCHFIRERPAEYAVPLMELYMYDYTPEEAYRAVLKWEAGV